MSEMELAQTMAQAQGSQRSLGDGDLLQEAYNAGKAGIPWEDFAEPHRGTMNYLSTPDRPFNQKVYEAYMRGVAFSQGGDPESYKNPRYPREYER